MILFHPGLPEWLAIVIGLFMLQTVIWQMFEKAPRQTNGAGLSLARVPLVAGVVRYLTGHTWPLMWLKVIFATLFLLIIWAGLSGTPVVERNLATTVTWNLWWTGIIIGIVFSGSAWCAVCPWNTIADWLVNHGLWRRNASLCRLQLKVPVVLRNVWPASLLFIGFTWLELGVGIVASPYATAMMALLMLVLATTVAALFEGKAFCRYMCPVGRTVGAYSQLAPVALRPIDEEICRNCKSLACYHGTEKVAPCPSKLVIGRLQENTYCTSCGNCTLSCPSQNIAWQLRSPAREAIVEARGHLDEAFFMLTILAITALHGLTMLDQWQPLVAAIAKFINDDANQLASFTIGLVACWLLPVCLFALVSGLTALSLRNNGGGFKKVFSGFAFVSLPLAFAYHLAHNLNHFVRESSDWASIMANPFGRDGYSLTMVEKHMRHVNIMIPEDVLVGLQAGLMLAGFIIAVIVIRHRGFRLFAAERLQLLPMLLFAVAVTGFNLWMLVQPMNMRI